MKTSSYFGLLGLILLTVLAIGGANEELMRPAGIVGLGAMVLVFVADRRKARQAKADAKESTGSRAAARRKPVRSGR